MADNTNKDYDFILNPQKTPKPPILDLSGASMFKRLALVGSGFLLILIIGVFGVSFLNRASSAQGQKLLEIAQSQEEISRIATTAQEKIGSKELLYRSLNVQYSINSSKVELLAALSNRGVKADPKKLAQGQNPENDALLVQGEQNAKFDETYKELLAQQLQNYQLLLQNAYESSSPSEKTIIENAFSQLELLSTKAD